MKIEAIYVSSYRQDVQLTRLCVASIRFWYPHIPIWLVKDEKYGRFNTRDIERGWNVKVYAAVRKHFGWGMGKLEILLQSTRSRCLLLDSDIVFAGKVLDELECYDEDFVVVSENYGTGRIEHHFFSLKKLKELDPGFRFPGYGFNTGQVVATSGVLCRSDFDPFVDWQASQVRHPDVFKRGEQGLLNYIVQRKMNEGSLTLRRVSFMVWPGEAANTEHIQVKDFTTEGRHRQLIHWAGLRWGKTLEQMPRSDILLHFEELYYNRVPLGAWLRRWRRVKARLDGAFVKPLKRAAKRLLKGKKPTPTAG
jgi:hypothetical protein